MSNKVQIMLMIIASVITLAIVSVVALFVYKATTGDTTLASIQADGDNVCAVKGTDDLYCVNNTVYLARDAYWYETSKNRFHKLPTTCSCVIPPNPLDVAMTDENARLKQELSNAREELFNYKNENELLQVNLDTAVQIAVEEVKSLQEKVDMVQAKCNMQTDVKSTESIKIPPKEDAVKVELPKVDTPKVKDTKPAKPKEVKKDKPKQTTKKKEEKKPVKKQTSKNDCSKQCK